MSTETLNVINDNNDNNELDSSLIENLALHISVEFRIGPLREALLSDKEDTHEEG